MSNLSQPVVQPSRYRYEVRESVHTTVPIRHSLGENSVEEGITEAEAQVYVQRLARYEGGRQSFEPTIVRLAKVDARSSQPWLFSAAIMPSMNKVQAAETAFGDLIELVPGVGPHGRYVLRDSGFPVSALYQFFVEGYSNEEIAGMLNGLNVDDVAKVHAFIDALL